MSQLENNYINHIGFVIDESGSMHGRGGEVVKVMDTQVAYLARRSGELDQETRATTYSFNTNVRCIHYDKDVLRLPSLAKDYRPSGQTSLIDATLLCIQEMKQTAQLHGDHAFLIYVITDGEENASHNRPEMLANVLRSLPDNWTVAVLVPDQRGVHEAKRFGFPAQNIGVWDTSKDFSEVGKVVERSTESWMTARAKGVRGTTNIFQLDVSKLDATTVSKTLQRLMPNEYRLFPVIKDDVIRPFVENRVGNYTTGKSFYQITKKEKIQSYKQICIRDKANGEVYTGDEARKILGLPDYEASVRPADHDRYDIFIQSTSVNRKLVSGTSVLVLN